MNSSGLYGKLRTARTKWKTVWKEEEAASGLVLLELILFYFSVLIYIYCIVLLYCCHTRSWTQNPMNTRQAFEH